jgi:hypothetical protein
VGARLGGSGEGCCLSAVGRGCSSGIEILLRCTERLDGGVYAFSGESSSLMRCSPVGCESYTTYWWSSSDRTIALTSDDSDERRRTRQSERSKGITAFVPQALHVFDDLQDLGYVGG